RPGRLRSGRTWLGPYGAMNCLSPTSDEGKPVSVQIDRFCASRRKLEIALRSSQSTPGLANGCHNVFREIGSRRRGPRSVKSLAVAAALMLLAGPVWASGDMSYSQAASISCKTYRLLRGTPRYGKVRDALVNRLSELGVDGLGPA